MTLRTVSRHQFRGHELRAASYGDHVTFRLSRNDSDKLVTVFKLPFGLCSDFAKAVADAVRESRPPKRGTSASALLAGGIPEGEHEQGVENDGATKASPENERTER